MKKIINKLDIIKKLENIWKELDNLQEQSVVQRNEEAMWEIGEAMGYIDNTIDSLQEN